MAGLGSIFGAFLGVSLFAILRSEQIKLRSSPNQGVHSSGKHAVYASAFTIPLMIWFVSFAAQLVENSAVGFHIIIAGSIVGFSIIVAVAPAFYGGAAFIQHWNLRFILARSGTAPLNIVRALEEARNRGLLVRVGGGYRFYHRLLQEHFAERDEPGYAKVPVIRRSYDR